MTEREEPASAENRRRRARFAGFCYERPKSLFPLIGIALEMVRGLRGSRPEGLLEAAFFYLVAVPVWTLFNLPVCILISLPALPFVLLSGVRLRWRE